MSADAPTKIIGWDSRGASGWWWRGEAGGVGLRVDITSVEMSADGRELGRRPCAHKVARAAGGLCCTNSPSLTSSLRNCARKSG
eukprot:CAMPEP_0182523992 /NCGR_PEP_ID=MMETSP1323-20130603/1479_1 /TAXON_ID=236787 /ORGANISM="Florenciella parvula, Strain RCC1693" /LENGTH=83 /DNA_ID=CAMNT_0024732483 /DNA_START=363 /DNA_END=611 /DNA_ORIENTATION=-